MPNNPIPLTYKLRFDGRDADYHQLEAYSAAQTLEGVIWALTISLNFAITGKVRQRGNLSSAVKIYISPPRRGSVINELNILVQENPFATLLVGGWTINTVTPYLNAVVGYSFKQALGVATEIPKGAKRYFRKLNGADLEKVVRRIEPPLTRGHKVIGKTADTLGLLYKRTELAQLDAESKSYLEARLKNEFYTIDTNVTSFNVLTGNGRLYHPDEQSTVSFSLTHGPFTGTSEVLTESMREYSRGHKGVIRITAQREETAEGRLKRLMVSAAEHVPQEDWDDGVDPLRARRD